MNKKTFILTCACATGLSPANANPRLFIYQKAPESHTLVCHYQGSPRLPESSTPHLTFFPLTSSLNDRLPLAIVHFPAIAQGTTWTIPSASEADILSVSAYGVLPWTVQERLQSEGVVQEAAIDRPSQPSASEAHSSPDGTTKEEEEEEEVPQTEKVIQLSFHRSLSVSYVVHLMPEDFSNDLTADYTTRWSFQTQETFRPETIQVVPLSALFQVRLDRIQVTDTYTDLALTVARHPDYERIELEPDSVKRCAFAVILVSPTEGVHVSIQTFLDPTQLDDADERTLAFGQTLEPFMVREEILRHLYTEPLSTFARIPQEFLFNLIQENSLATVGSLFHRYALLLGARVIQRDVNSIIGAAIGNPRSIGVILSRGTPDMLTLILAEARQLLPGRDFAEYIQKFPLPRGDSAMMVPLRQHRAPIERKDTSSGSAFTSSDEENPSPRGGNLPPEEGEQLLPVPPTTKAEEEGPVAPQLLASLQQEEEEEEEPLPPVPPTIEAEEEGPVAPQLLAPLQQEEEEEEEPLPPVPPAVEAEEEAPVTLQPLAPPPQEEEEEEETNDTF